MTPAASRGQKWDFIWVLVAQMHILMRPGWCVFVLSLAPTLALRVQVCAPVFFCFNFKLKHWRHFYNQAFWKSKFLSGTEEGIFPGLASIEWRGRAWRSFHMDGKMHHHCPYFTGAVYKCSITRWNCCFSNMTSTSISKSKHRSLRGRNLKLFCWINKLFFFCWRSHYIRGSNRLAVRRHHPAAFRGSRM